MFLLRFKSKTVSRQIEWVLRRRNNLECQQALLAII